MWFWMKIMDEEVKGCTSWCVFESKICWIKMSRTIGCCEIIMKTIKTMYNEKVGSLWSVREENFVKYLGKTWIAKESRAMIDNWFTGWMKNIWWKMMLSVLSCDLIVSEFYKYWGLYVKCRVEMSISYMLRGMCSEFWGQNS